MFTYVDPVSIWISALRCSHHLHPVSQTPEFLLKNKVRYRLAGFGEGCRPGFGLGRGAHTRTADPHTFEHACRHGWKQNGGRVEMLRLPYAACLNSEVDEAISS